MNTPRNSDFTVFIVHDAPTGDTWRFTDEQEAYRMWLEIEGAQCDAYNAAERWSMGMDAQFEDWRDDDEFSALSVARHNAAIQSDARVAS